MSLFKTLGNRLRAARTNANLTLDDLRKKTGLSKGFLSDLENDKRNPSASNVCLLSDNLDVSVEWLLRGKHDNPMTCPLCKGEGKLTF